MSEQMLGRHTKKIYEWDEVEIDDVELDTPVRAVANGNERVSNAQADSQQTGLSRFLKRKLF